MRYVSVRVVDSGGRPKRDSRVAIEVHQFLAGGIVGKQTNSDGMAQFRLNVDEGAEITIMVDGNVRVQRGSIRADYSVTG